MNNIKYTILNIKILKIDTIKESIEEKEIEENIRFDKIRVMNSPRNKFLKFSRAI